MIRIELSEGDPRPARIAISPLTEVIAARELLRRDGQGAVPWP
ncbi:hypothetical protein [Dactylosporangium matsuzakiense]|nr:hypothetical protein [Dactylosporangium matsuzakiense]